MRTLFEIIESAQDNRPTTHEECLYAMLVIDALWHFDRRDLRNLAFDNTKVPVRVLAKESFARCKKALQIDPKVYLGSNDPANPDYQRMRKALLAEFEKRMALKEEQR